MEKDSQQMPQPKGRTVRIVALSDTHDKHKDIKVEDLPPGDIFIHAGDFTRMSRRKEYERFRLFLASLPYKHKVVVAGNHDFGLEPNQEVYEAVSQHFQIKPKEKVVPHEEVAKLKEVCTYLMHEQIEIQGIRIFGSPYVNANYKMGFTYPDIQGEQVWANLPQNIDILVTHNPPHGILDRVIHHDHNVGCKFLREAVRAMKPKIHIFGHIHESHGHCEQEDTRFYNVAFVNEKYSVAHGPTVIDIFFPDP